MAASARSSESNHRGSWSRLQIRPWMIAAVLAFVAAFAHKLGDVQSLQIEGLQEAYVRRLLFVVTVYAAAGAAVLAAVRFAPQPLPWRAAVFVVALAVGIETGYSIAAGFDEMSRMWRADPVRVFTEPSRFLLFGLLGVTLLLMDERDRVTRRLLHDEQLRMIDLTRATDEARLALLQAQVEPHFLFNTLAHLQHLYSRDAAAGRAMMLDVLCYLTDAEPALQLEAIPLRQDAKLALTYLKLQQVRMRERLAYSFDIGDAAASARVPPLTLTTLVENAIKHGLAPQPAGGHVWISATADGTGVRIDVADDGRGLQASFGSGVGLSNLRARLALLHGASASLELTQRRPSGILATVFVPHGAEPMC
jgi:signal transduction histidine kinase